MQKHFFLVFVAVILVLSAVSLAGSFDRLEKLDKNSGKRVIAHSDSEVSAALEKGCNLVRHIKDLRALRCSENAAALLGLQEDIMVFAVDSNANKQIKADLVHASGNTGAGRKIAVVDTGYNYNHPELATSYLGGKDFVNDDSDPMDDNGHGSHVAGLITADGVNSRAKGAAPDAGILAAKVLSASGSGFFSDVTASIYWAVDGEDGVYGTADDPNADAISMSLGTSPPYTYRGFCDSVLPDLTAAINYARSKNVAVVVAAGNSGSAGVSIPGCISTSVTVGAVDSRNRPASFSGRGSAVDISAPGVSLFSAWLGTSYATASGTSMSTPVVSGTVALIKKAHANFTVLQVENALFKTATDYGPAGKDNSYGWGVVNAQKAVAFAG